MKNLKALSFLLFLLMGVSTTLSATNTDDDFLRRKVLLTASQPDAEIFINGKLMATGEAEVVILRRSCVTVVVKKVGYLNAKVVFCNKKNAPKPPKTYHVDMKKDDAYDSSVQTDLANVDVEIKTQKENKMAWKLLSQIITGYFDVIEITDRDTGYMRTSWSVKSFEQSTIRTRVILKESSTEPLKYKIKLVSEIAPFSGASVKKDEYYSEWDRVLRKYKDLISELQSRL